jgi:hypothetical protein
MPQPYTVAAPRKGRSGSHAPGPVPWSLPQVLEPRSPRNRAVAWPPHSKNSEEAARRPPWSFAAMPHFVRRKACFRFFLEPLTLRR